MQQHIPSQQEKFQKNEMPHTIQNTDSPPKSAQTTRPIVYLVDKKNEFTIIHMQLLRELGFHVMLTTGKTNPISLHSSQPPVQVNESSLKSSSIYPGTVEKVSVSVSAPPPSKLSTTPQTIIHNPPTQIDSKQNVDTHTCLSKGFQKAQRSNNIKCPTQPKPFREKKRNTLLKSNTKTIIEKTPRQIIKSRPSKKRAFIKNDGKQGKKKKTNSHVSHKTTLALDQSYQSTVLVEFSSESLEPSREALEYDIPLEDLVFWFGLTLIQNIKVQ